MKFSIKDFFSRCDQIRSTADSVTFTEENLNGKLHFSCSVLTRKGTETSHASDFFLYIPLRHIREYRCLKKVIHQTARK